MTSPFDPSAHLSRRGVLGTAAGAALAATVSERQSGAAPPSASQSSQAARVAAAQPCRKSINLWAFPYPQRMNLEQCLRLAKDAGFDAVELNYDLESDLSPRHGTAEYVAIRRLAETIGIGISGVCSFLFWPYPLTSNDPDKRQGCGRLSAGRRRQPEDKQHHPDSTHGAHPTVLPGPTARRQGSRNARMASLMKAASGGWLPPPAACPQSDGIGVKVDRARNCCS